MTDHLTPERRSANMRAVRVKHTGPEMIVRRLAHGMGYRYRLHERTLPGKPDLVFRPRRKVIFVHGCFWHGHPRCRRAGRPQTHAEFWRTKLDRNITRDAEHLLALEREGWRALVVWECETKDREALRARLESFLEIADERPQSALTIPVGRGTIAERRGGRDEASQGRHGGGGRRGEAAAFPQRRG